MGHDNSLSFLDDTWSVPHKYYYLRKIEVYEFAPPGTDTITGVRMKFSPVASLAGQGYVDQEHTFGVKYNDDLKTHEAIFTEANPIVAYKICVSTSESDVNK